MQFEDLYDGSKVLWFSTLLENQNRIVAENEVVVQYRSDSDKFAFFTKVPTSDGGSFRSQVLPEVIDATLQAEYHDFLLQIGNAILACKAERGSDINLELSYNLRTKKLYSVQIDNPQDIIDDFSAPIFYDQANITFYDLPPPLTEVSDSPDNNKRERGDSDDADEDDDQARQAKKTKKSRKKG